METFYGLQYSDHALFEWIDARKSMKMQKIMKSMSDINSLMYLAHVTMHKKYEFLEFEYNNPSAC